MGRYPVLVLSVLSVSGVLAASVALFTTSLWIAVLLYVGTVAVICLVLLMWIRPGERG